VEPLKGGAHRRLHQGWTAPLPGTSGRRANTDVENCTMANCQWYKFPRPFPIVPLPMAVVQLRYLTWNLCPEAKVPALVMTCGPAFLMMMT